MSLTDIFGSTVPPPGGIKEPNIPNMLAIATNEAGLDSDQKINMTKYVLLTKDFFQRNPCQAYLLFLL